MNKRYRLGEIEEAVSEMEELIDIEDDIAEIDDEFQIVVSGWSVYVESLNLTLRQGIHSFQEQPPVAIIKNGALSIAISNDISEALLDRIFQVIRHA